MTAVVRAAVDDRRNHTHRQTDRHRDRPSRTINEYRM